MVRVSGKTPGSASFHAPPIAQTLLPSFAAEARFSSVDPLATPFVGGPDRAQLKRLPTMCTSVSADCGKLASPEYVANSVLLPVDPEARLHELAATGALQLLVPSVTVTVPVGSAGEFVTSVTCQVTVYGCPTPDGSGSS